MMRPLVLLSLIGWSGLAFSCSGQSTPATVKPGIYRATLQTKGGPLPFGLAIQPGKQRGTYAAYAINGTERLAMDSATATGDSIRIPMRLFDSELVARINGNKLTGTWRRYRTAQQTLTLPFQAELGPTYRFVPDSQSATTSVAGTWATEFGNKRTQVDTVNAVGVFSQTGNRVSGTFLTPTGDYRYLDGNVVGDSLFLSCFDGSHLFLFKAKQNPTTKLLTGGFWAGVSGYESWVANADPNAKLPDPATLTYLKPGVKTLNVSFPEPSGNVVSLTDPRYKGKVTVVQILGSWCPNCMDETNFLSPWYKKNRQRGVEILGLSFERSANMNESGPKIDRMKQRFQIDYPIVLAGTNDKAKAATALPDLNAVVAFPTTLILDKKGQVRHVYTGFNGPGTGKYYDQYVDAFNSLIDKLLAEK